MTRLPVLLLLVATSVAAAPSRDSIIPPKPSAPAGPPPPPPADATRVLPLTDVIADWQARWDLARALSYVKRYDESLAEYRRILAERPGEIGVRQDYGQVLLWSGRPEEAYQELSRIPRDQLSGDAAIALADTLLGRHDFAGAETIYRAQLQRNPADQLTRLKLAEVLSWTKRADESLALFREILAALPDDTQVRRRYALALIASGRSAEAAEELRRTLPE